MYLTKPLREMVTFRTEKAMPSDYPDKPFIGLDDIQPHTSCLLGTKPSSSMKSSAKKFHPGDVLYSRLRPYLNKVWLADRSGLCSSEFIVLPSNERMDGQFLKFRISARDFVSFANSLNAGDRPRVDFDQISSFLIPCIPLDEQKQIVAKIEELFSELDAGEVSLRKAKSQLATYRQSLLKQAFEGKLTVKWRKDHQEFKTKLSERSELGRHVVEKLGKLPSVWQWIFLSEVGELARGKSKHRPRNDPKLFGGPYPFVQTAEIKAASKNLKTFTQTYSEFGLSQSKLWPKGTLCITIAANIAQTAFLGFDACFPDSIVGFSPDADMIDSEYVELFFRSARHRIEQYAPATAQKNINLETLENLMIPLCSLPEQKEIVRILDGQFEEIDRNEREIDQALAKSEVLRQSVLQKAFSGGLLKSAAIQPHANTP